MKDSAFIAIIFLICCAVAVAGCTSSQTSSSGSTAGASGTTSASSLTTSPTDVMATNIAVSVTVGQKNDQGTIPVTFDGGAGQGNVNTITVTLTRADGSTQVKTLGSDKGDQVLLAGTERTPGTLTGAADRVQVAVTMNNGQTYNIVDVLRT
ncbi:hypothetical protein [Methanoregula sp.]|uniref:hypothetical protein n=1 Tax=Methanoregula sp. TaxID=2052170 RepID=UPI003BAFC797